VIVKVIGKTVPSATKGKIALLFLSDDGNGKRIESVKHYGVQVVGVSEDGNIAFYQVDDDFPREFVKIFFGVGSKVIEK